MATVSQGLYWDDANNGTFNSTLSNISLGLGDGGTKKCPEPDVQLYDNFTGVDLAVPFWQALVALIVLGLIILLTIVGNILVILSVFTYKPLRIVQNFFIVSLAVADLTVAILVLPLNVAYSLLGRWEFGKLVCTMWLTSDVMCCTASILNLCAIALDRYWAITDPINYAQKRTVRRVVRMIALVWVLSALICSPPLIGWNDWPEVFNANTPCQLTSQKGYIIYSSLGSFYIPLFIMTVVYIEIFVATRRRLRERANAARLAIKNCTTTQNHSVKERPSPIDQESVSSETNHNEPPSSHKAEKKKKNKKKKKKSNEDKIKHLTVNYVAEDSVTEANDERRHSTNYDESCRTTVTTTTTTTTASESPHSRCASQVGNNPPPATKVVQVYQFIEEKQKISLSKERRAARTLGIIMGVFVICWLPFFLMYVIVPFCNSCCPSDVFVNVITWLGYINSALNPIIYTIFNLDFRRAFKKLLRIKSTT